MAGGQDVGGAGHQEGHAQGRDQGLGHRQNNHIILPIMCEYSAGHLFEQGPDEPAHLLRRRRRGLLPPSLPGCNKEKRKGQKSGR